jgi:hypothetical protein
VLDDSLCKSGGLEEAANCDVFYKMDHFLYFFTLQIYKEFFRTLGFLEIHPCSKETLLTMTGIEGYILFDQRGSSFVLRKDAFTHYYPLIANKYYYNV